MFAGVGPIAVPAAKRCKRVLANDLNPSALTYLAHNVLENRVQAKVEVIVTRLCGLPLAPVAS